jgi:hypothetical protein
MPAVVDQDVHVAGLLGELHDAVEVVEVGSDEACTASPLLDRGDGLGATLRVTADDDHFGARLGELERHCAADARGCPGDERALLIEFHACSLGNVLFDTESA